MADVAEQTPFIDAAAAISQGKRHLLVRDYTAAVTAFAEGLELLAQKHGDCGDELGEPYLLYGRALLGLAREEAGVLGGAVPGSEEDGEDEDGEEDKLSNVDEKEETETAEIGEPQVPSSNEVPTESAVKTPEENVKKVDDKSSEEDEKKIDQGNASSSKEETATTNGETNGNIPSGSGEDDEDDINKEDDEEDAGRGIDLQVAWEVLELAKIVFFKRGASGIKQLAEAHRLLGEVAMESGNHQVAVVDLEQALGILKNIEPNESRAMAELHYQLGLAHSLLNEFDASIMQFNEATNLLEARIKELEATKEPPKSDDPFYTIAGEITELKELLPEIQEKITDMKDFKQEACKIVIEGIKSKVAGSCSNGAGPSSAPDDAGSSSAAETVSPKQSKPASDISHLVRKKRKADESEPANPSPCKKPTP